jgi:hypothetical protein
LEVARRAEAVDDDFKRRFMGTNASARRKFRDDEVDGVQL